MKETDRTELKQRIEEAITSTHKDIERLEVASRPVAPDKALGRLTRMESLNDRGVSQAALSAAQERLYKLELAIKKVAQPGYGDCAICGRPIPVERLLALPEANRCVTCAAR